MAAGQLMRIVQHIRQLVGTGEGAGTDAQLLARYAESGDSDAFAVIVERHGTMVLGVCQRVLVNSHDAEDAFQAVFVVLARKAGTVCWRDSAGPWLHEVAHRIARRARARAGCRAAHERRAADMRPTDTRAEPAWADLRDVLDDELGRLPAKYRAPLLLCYVEGKSNEAAAAQLGWPAGTVKSRLSRGRELLRNRLARRGLALAAETLVLLVAQNAAASVPAAMTDTVIQAASAVAAGHAVGGLTGPAAALAQGALRTMWLTKLRNIAAVTVMLVMVAGGAGWAMFHAWAADPATAAKQEISLPKDPKTVVLSMTVGGGRLRNASPDPFLQIMADGKVIRTDRISGAKRESRLTPAELQELLRFVIQQNDFFNVTGNAIEAGKQQAQAGKAVAIAVGDGRTSGIHVQANDKQHDVSCYAASTFQGQFPNVKPLAQFVAVESRLDQLAYILEVAPQAGEAARPAVALPNDPKAVVLSLTMSHKEIATRKEARPGGGFAIYQGSPRADQVLQIQADGTVIVNNRAASASKEFKLNAAQLQDVLRFVIQENEFFTQNSVKLAEKDNPDARKLVLTLNADGKQHEISIDGRPADAKSKLTKSYTWLDNLARNYVGSAGWQY
jgi:RNA polymerase sigma factor (sigma-70 family)